MEAKDQLLPELQREILSYKPPCKLKRFLSKNPEYEYLFSSEDSLMKLAEDYGLPYYKGITLNDLCMYFEISKLELLLKASELGDVRVVNFLTQPHKIIKYRFTKDNYNSAMANAALGGHIEIVKLMLKLGANNYNSAMANAAYGGYIEIVEMMLELGAYDYNWAMENAAGMGHMKIVEIMLERGAKDYNSAVKNAAGMGHLEIVKIMLEQGADDYNQIMVYAAYGGHLEIVKMMLELGANDYDVSIAAAIRGGHTEIVDLIKFYM